MVVLDVELFANKDWKCQMYFMDCSEFVEQRVSSRQMEIEIHRISRVFGMTVNKNEKIIS